MQLLIIYWWTSLLLRFITIALQLSQHSAASAPQHNHVPRMELRSQPYFINLIMWTNQIGWRSQDEPTNPTSSRRSLKDNIHIHPTVKAFMLVDDSEARPLPAGSASISAVKALMTRPPMHKEHNVAAKRMATTSFLMQVVLIQVVG